MEVTTNRKDFVEEPSRRPSRVFLGNSLVLELANEPTTAVSDIHVKASEDAHSGATTAITDQLVAEDPVEEEIDNGLRVIATNNSKSSAAPTLTVYSEEDDVEQMLADLLQEDHSQEEESQVSEIDLDLGFDIDLLRPEKDLSDEQFKRKPKHFFILSSAGKPIYSMNGSDDVVTNYMGVISTILSFFEENDDAIKSIRIKNTLITFLNKAPIILVAISSLPYELETHLIDQLNLLYFYLLSILTKPFITKVFTNRENYDLRRILNKTDVNNLDNLCTKICFNEQNYLVGGLECLKLPKKIRTKLNSILLNQKKDSPDLLYGLIVAPNGRLISCLRPKKHSLHTIDLQMLFEMAFNNTFKNDISNESSSEEYWVPICLPKFNPNGFLYCFINFLNLNCFNDLRDTVKDKNPNNEAKNDGFAIILLSANKNSFFEMQKASDRILKNIVEEKLHEDLNTALSMKRVSIKRDIQSPLIRHFIYKSKTHLQYVMSDFDEVKLVPNGKYQLLYVYSQLHASLDSNINANATDALVPSKKMIYLKWKNDNNSITGMAWCNANYEIYCLSNGIVRKDILIESCKKIVNWCRKNEERLFVCGGAIF